MKTQICSICHQSFTEYGNSAHPINDGRCCDYCDDFIVTPVRMSVIAGKPKEAFLEETITFYKIKKERKEQYDNEHKRDDQVPASAGLQSPQTNQP